MKVLVLGDICLDTNHFGKVDRISPEAPVPVFLHERSESKLGMSGNVALNLKALNIITTVSMSTNHHDSSSQNILDMLSYNIISNLDLSSADKTTITKERYFVGNHYLFRCDKEKVEPLFGKDKEKILKEVSEDYDAIILQDYAKGFFDRELIQLIVENKNPRTLLLADGHSSRNSEFYHGVDYLKLNEKESNEVFREEFSLSVALSKIKNVIVTRGSNSTILHRRRHGYEKYIELPPINNVLDVTGAGDVFIAHLAYHLLNKKTIVEAIELSNNAASYSTTKLGCYAPTLEEVEKNLRKEHNIYG